MMWSVCVSVSGYHVRCRAARIAYTYVCVERGSLQRKKSDKAPET